MFGQIGFGRNPIGIDKINIFVSLCYCGDPYGIWDKSHMVTVRWFIINVNIYLALIYVDTSCDVIWSLYIFVMRLIIDYVEIVKLGYFRTMHWYLWFWLIFPISIKLCLLWFFQNSPKNQEKHDFSQIFNSWKKKKTDF